MATSYKHRKVSRVFRDLKNIKFCAKNNIYRLCCEEWEVANNAEYKQDGTCTVARHVQIDYCLLSIDFKQTVSQYHAILSSC